MKTIQSSVVDGGLFPETIPVPTLYGTTGPRPKFESDQVDPKWGHPLLIVHLLPRWSTHEGWRVGWLVMMDNVSADEWLPGATTAPNWPWYRPSEQPVSRKFGLACGVAARAAKIVIEQMLTYTADADTVAAARAVQERMETQARRWLLGDDA